MTHLIGLLARYGLTLARVADDTPIPGSYWGESEAGLIGQVIYARADTPVHSVLHEACHVLCMDVTRRATLHTDAGGDYAEEDAVCFLQIPCQPHRPVGGGNLRRHGCTGLYLPARLGARLVHPRMPKMRARGWFDTGFSPRAASRPSAARSLIGGSNIPAVEYLPTSLSFADDKTRGRP